MFPRQETGEKVDIKQEVDPAVISADQKRRPVPCHLLLIPGCTAKVSVQKSKEKKNLSPR